LGFAVLDDVVEVCPTNQMKHFRLLCRLEF
jgi:hypothetical protein